MSTLPEHQALQINKNKKDEKIICVVSQGPNIRNNLRTLSFKRFIEKHSLPMGFEALNTSNFSFD